MSDTVACSIAALHVWPVKSCAGIAPAAVRIDATGFELDRVWMVVDGAGEMQTQRTRPRLALVATALRGSELVLRAPGMLALHLRTDAVDSPCRVRVCGDIVAAFDMGPLAAQWITDCLAPRRGERLRIVRFDPDERRLSDAAWCGGVAAENAFSDGFPLLVANAASLADLNARLAARGSPAVTMARFRPNVVVEGLAAWDEDHLRDLVVEGSDGAVTLRLVKPCVRCAVPNVDPSTADVGTEPGATLATFRADARAGGGVTFGANAVVVDGVGRRIAVGQRATATWNFA